MAERRMFAKKIIDSDAFLDLALSTQSLYFHLSMRADDDGFINNPKKIMRMIGASQNEMETLIQKRFLIAFEGGIVVIKHWRIHNYIQKDRYNPTLYQEIYKQIKVKGNQAYTDDVYSMDTQCIQDGDTGKVRLVKVSEVKDIKPTSESRIPPCPVEQIISMYQDQCTRLPKLRVIPDKTKNAISARWRQDTRFQSLQFWEGFFDYCNENKFLSGQANPRPGSERAFRADLNWVVNATNFANILNEKYS